MQKRFKTVSMMLFLLGAITGTAYAAPSSVNADDVRITQQSGTCTGVVKDASGETVIGASVVVKGTTNGTITDFDGAFSLSNVKKGDVIQISFVGYKTQEVVWNGNPLSIVLKDDAQALEEVVVVGFGSQKKTNLTGSVAQVKMSEVLGDRPITNVKNALQGSIPGLMVSGGASPGESKSFQIRGTVSINGMSPLVLIDNVEGNIDLINPEDIESISVLKDAASSAIYGARAAAGVILVTTKKAKRGEKFSLNYNNNFGFSTSINRPEQASLTEYLRAYQAAGIGDTYYAGGGSVTRWVELLNQYQQDPSSLEIQGDGLYTENGKVYFMNDKDVYKAFQETSFMQSHNVSAQGGTDKLRYRIGLGYSKEDGPLVYSKDTYARKNISTYISSDITSWFTQEADIRYVVADRSTPNAAGSGGGIYRLNEISFSPQGLIPASFISGSDVDLPSNTPANNILYSNPTLTDTENTRIYLRSVFKPLKGLEIVGEYTYDRKNDQQSVYTNKWNYTTEELGTLTSTENDNYYMYEGHTDYSALNIYGTYDFKLKENHNFKIMAGFNQERKQSSSFSARSYDQIAPSAPTIAGNVGQLTASNDYSDYAIRGGFFRFNYNYMDKYLFEVNGRYDGSSKFPKDDRFGFFPSLSAGWNIAKESWMEKTENWLSELKFRASWGQIGNQNISNYAYFPSMQAYETSSWLKDGEKVTYISAPGLVSSSFTWEVVETLDFGLDATLLNNRLKASFDWYQRDTRDMLIAGTQLPALIGTSAPTRNAADMRTRGWELSMSWRDQIGDWGYNVGFNIYDHTSKITKYDLNQEKLLSESYYEGKTLGEIWGYVSEGSYYSIDDFDAAGSWKLNEGITSIRGTAVRPGDEKFVNLRDDVGENEINGGLGTVESPGDQKVIGNSTARYNYGINLGVNYKGFALSAILQGTVKRDVVLSGAALYPFRGEGKGYLPVFYNQTNYWEPMGDQGGQYTTNDNEYWVAKNPNAELFRIYGQMSNAGSNMRTSTKYLQNGAYMRIKNVTLSYTFPKEMINKWYLNGLKFFVSAENLATFTSLPKGYDPERLNWGYPFYRTVSFGLNVTL